MSPTPPPARQTAHTTFGRIEYLDGGHDQGSLMADFLVAAGLRAIIPSRPGYLGSELTDANRSIDGTADAHAALMATLGIDRFAVLCWSGGGPACWRLAAGGTAARRHGMETNSARSLRWLQ